MTADPALASAIRASWQVSTVDTATVTAWLEGLERAGHYSVTPHDLTDLRGWSVDPATGDLSHESGRFFSVRGADADVSVDGRHTRWRQPIVVQTDVGVLGIVACVVDGVLMVLVQAKMEPGNRRLVQVSPTVQATASNFERVHRGDPTPYLDVFGEPESPPPGARFLVRNAQTEQGTRYLGKRNLNAIVLVDRADPVDDRFRWLTLADVTALAGGDELLHMDTRSVLGTFPLGGVDPLAQEPVDDVLGWVAAERDRVRTQTRLIPLNEVPDWRLAEGRITGPDPFEVVGVRVSATSREVASWDQPLVRNAAGAEGVLLVRRGPGGPQVLVRVLTGLGVPDAVELGPSIVTWAPGEVDVPLAADDEARALAASGTVVLDRLLPEEGGRFLHSSVRHVVVEVDPSTSAAPAGTRWITLGQARTLGSQTSLLDMELRSLLACLPATLRVDAVA